MCIAAWAWHCHPTHRLLLLFNRDEYHSSLCPLEYATEIAKEADQYNGFNLILADVNSGTMVYISNRPGGDPVIQTVAPGLHVLSNAAINSPWPKAMRLGQSFKRPDRSMVPDTGDDPEWEYKLSSIFIDTAKEQARYGTRSMVALAAKLEGEVTFYERYLENSLWKENLIQFQMEKAQ
uniref:Ser/Thr-rich protein T10 in DGCR region n=1 Tax=Zea mays TaxID=4577 RepID=A0A804UMZ5_MAIZE